MMDPQPQPQPLILCMENVSGEEVALRIEPSDDFQTFLSKAKSTLGFDVDINSVTHNQPVSLTDNIYQFLMSADHNLDSQVLPSQAFDQVLPSQSYDQVLQSQSYDQVLPSQSYDQVLPSDTFDQVLPPQSFDPMLEPSYDPNDLVYELDDGTQIRASQIHFDNEDPHVDLSAEKIPFVKYTDDVDDSELENVGDQEVRKFNIVDSPVSRWASKECSPKSSFSNTLPFKLVCNNTSAFEAQFTKYLESSAAKTYTTLNPVTNRNKSPRSLIRDNYKSYDDKFSRGDDFTGYTREEVLNMFKDSPVASLPYEGQTFNEKRRHVRKTDPSRSVHKSWNAKPVNYDDGILIGDTENQNCIICGKFVENKNDKLYVFDNEDQKRHRASPQKRTATHLKIICESCLEENFKPGRMKGPNQSLSPDEYLVIRNNQQYIFQKTKKFDFKTTAFDAEALIEKDNHKRSQEKEKVEFVKVEIGSDGEIVTKPIDNDPRSSDDVIIVKDEDKEASSSDVEIIEPPEIDENIIDNLDDADEDVKEFLGKYQTDNTETELKCRFCERIFSELSEVVDHVEEHKHDLEEGVVYPCPLCDYGYSNSKWLKGHLKAAHDKARTEKSKDEDETPDNKEPKSKAASPIAKRTRSSSKKADDSSKESPVKTSENTAQLVSNAESADATLLIKTEVKQEAIASSDDEIWIVQTGDDDATKHLESLLHAAKGCQNGEDTKKMHKCSHCGRIFKSEECLSSHKCRLPRRGRKRKAQSTDIRVPTHEDFVKRAQGRPRTMDNSDDMLVVRPRRRKNKEPTSDPQIVTCHNCNESFTSKVRLKFHMQFHDTPAPNGRYTCTSCPGASFATETALFDHVHFQHHRRRRWRCPVAACGKSFYLRATLTKHSRTHTDTRRYVCVTCGKRFLDKQTLDEHGVTHLQIKPFQCHICLKQLTRRSRLRMHLRAHEEALAPTLVLVCACCRRAFGDASEAKDHAAKSTECIEAFARELKEEAEEVTAQLSPTSGLVRETRPATESPKLSNAIPRQVSEALAEPLLSALNDEARGIIRVVEIEKAFRCEYCEDVFYQEDALNSHRAIHKDVKNPFTCHICKVSFATYSRCTTHKTTHGFYKRSLAEAKKNASKPSEPEAGPSATGILGYGGFPVVKHFLCEDCGRSYLHWTYLQVHRRMKHANDFLYKCNHCDLTFPNSWSLAYHRKKIHGQTGQGDANSTTKIPREDYRIPCRDCDEVLPNKTALYKHRKKEHSDMTLGENNNPDSLWCGRCGAGVPSRAALDAHVRAHAAAAASCACGRAAAGAADLHERAETVCRRTHACPVCAHTFRSASARDEHVRTHTGARPFPCDVCGLAFRRSTAMRNHRLIHSDVRLWACTRCPKRFRARSDLHAKHPARLAVIAILSTAMRNHRLIHSDVRLWACTRCPKRFRARSDLRAHVRAKHPARLAVIEVRGLNPTPDEVMEYLKLNNISHEKVIEITKMSFAKGTTSIIPNCARALSMLGNVPRTQVACSKPVIPVAEEDYQPPRRGRGIAKHPRRPKILQRGDEPPQLQASSLYPVSLSVTGGELTDMDVQMLLRDGVFVNGNQMVQLQLGDNMLLE